MGAAVKTKSVKTEYLEPGMVLASGVFVRGLRHALIKKGTTLSKDLIFGLSKRKIPSVLIEDVSTYQGSVSLPMPPDARRIEGIPFTFPGSVEERIFSEKNGRIILKIDDPAIRETRIKAVKTAHEVLHKISKDKKLDINVAKDTADGLISAINDNKSAFLNITGMRMIDEYTFVHSVNVAAYSTILAMEYGVSGKDLEPICLGALLHDAGKMLVDQKILKKPGKLTSEEFEEMKTHPMKGYEILKVNGIDDERAGIARGHHERLDGNGYPSGFAGGDIPISSQIAAITDVYDALTSDRVYKKAMESNNAMVIIMSESGKHFNAELVSLFQRAVGIYPIGSQVRMNNGSVARVLEQNEGVVKPVIQLLFDENGELYEDRAVINLMDNSYIYMVEVLINKNAA